MALEITAREILGPGGWIAQEFPEYEDRPQQLQLMDAFEEATERECLAVTEAATGTGKSLGYLTPIILDAVTTGRQWVVSTADKNLQRQLVHKDIPFLQEVFRKHGINVRAVLLKGRANFICRYKIDTTLEMKEGLSGLFDDGDTFDRLVEWSDSSEGDLDEVPFDVPFRLRDQLTVDSDTCIGRKCSRYEDCHVENRKREARKAHIIVVNHALLLRDLGVREATEGYAHVIPVKLAGDVIRKRGRHDPDYDDVYGNDGAFNEDGVRYAEIERVSIEDAAGLVMDEVHNLRAIAVDSLATEYTANAFRRLQSRIEPYTTRHDLADPTAERYVTAAREVYANAEGYFQDSIEPRLLKSQVLHLGDETYEAAGLTEALDAYATLLEEGPAAWLDSREAEMWRRIARSTRRMCEAVTKIVSPVDPQKANLVRYAERDGRNIKIVLKPIDVADKLNDMLWSKFGTVLCTSATLATMDGFTTWKEEVGADNFETVECVVGSPFDFEHNSMLFLPPNGDAFDPAKVYGKAGEEEYFDRLALTMFELVDASNGGAFLLFTSRRVMNAVWDRIGAKLEGRWPAMMQAPGVSRPEMIRLFKEHGNAVILGVKSFWEGVDVQGDALRLVVIDKLPFVPPDDPVFDARKERLTRRTGDQWAWFNKMAIPNVILQMKQAAGRLLRTKTDRGVVAILDGRIASKSYGLKVIKALPPMPRTRDIEDVRAFFQKGGD